MIKAKNKTSIILGLSDENMRRLSEGQPIKFNLSEFNMSPMDVLIFNGRTEEDMEKELAPYMNENTEIRK